MNVPNPTAHNQWYPFGNRPLPPESGAGAANPAVIPVFDPAPLPASARFVVIGAGQGMAKGGGDASMAGMGAQMAVGMGMAGAANAEAARAARVNTVWGVPAMQMAIQFAWLSLLWAMLA